MINRKIRGKAYLFSEALKYEFIEVGDKQGEQLFDIVRIVLGMDELTLKCFLNMTIIFAKEELKNKSSLN